MNEYSEASSLLYHYLVEVVEVYDGDTITVNFDFGFGHKWENQKIRLARINAPEVRGAEREAGLTSRNWLRDQILGKKVVIRTIKDKHGKYGRYLADVYSEEGEILNDKMVRLNLAEYREY